MVPSAKRTMQWTSRVAFAVGIFLLVGATNALVNAGRIDIIDGQYRFEVARNLLVHRSLQVTDTALSGAVEGVSGRYAPYPVAGSVLGVPFVWFAGLFGPVSQDRQQFVFSFASPVFGGITAAVLFLFLTSLGIGAGSALKWTFVSSFATLMFPASTTVFDQVQHSCFILTACYLCYLSRQRDSLILVGIGGLAVAGLVNFQETYAILIPALGAATWAWDSQGEERRRAVQRVIVFVVTASLGLLVWALMNKVRFGSFLFSGRGINHPAPFGNPVIGLAGLLVSPGKSVFLYSAPIVIALAGLPALFRRDHMLAISVISAASVQLLLASSLSFFGGDWCWGPRYFVPILPLLALALPFATPTVPRRRMAAVLIVAGISAQTMGLAVEHHRFFYERSLRAFFWAADPTFYFRDSALFARPREIVETFKGVPAGAETFRPGPYPELLTYAVFGEYGYPELSIPEWQKKFKVFWLPRPWFAWMSAVPEAARPVNLVLTATAIGGAWLLGAVLLIVGHRNQKREKVP